MITCWQSIYRPAEGRVASDRAIIARAMSPRSCAAKADVPRWAGNEYRFGYRSLASFTRAWWLVFDFDAGASREQLEEAFGDCCGVAHTTWTPGRWRVAIALSVSVESVEQFDRVWRAGATLAERHRLAPDYAARSAAHCFALPARHDGAPYDFVELTGALFDVETALALIPPQEQLPVPNRSHTAGDHGDALERAGRYLEKMPGAVSGSGGHATTFKAACVLVRGFGLEPEAALRLLIEIHNPMCAPAWSERELVHKVKQAHQSCPMTGRAGS